MFANQALSQKFKSVENFYECGIYIQQAIATDVATANS